MICVPCRDRDHEKCDGITKHRTYCDCAHKQSLYAEVIRDLTRKMNAMALIQALDRGTRHDQFKDQVERFMDANDELLRRLALDDRGTA